MAEGSEQDAVICMILGQPVWKKIGFMTLGNILKSELFIRVRSKYLAPSLMFSVSSPS